MLALNHKLNAHDDEGTATIGDNVRREKQVFSCIAVGGFYFDPGK